MLPVKVLPVARRRGGVVVASLAVPPCRPSSRGAGTSSALRTTAVDAAADAAAAATRGAPAAIASGSVAELIRQAFGVVAQGGGLENKERAVSKIKCFILPVRNPDPVFGKITIRGQRFRDSRAGAVLFEL